MGMRRSGFTLVETMIATSIFALVTAMLLSVFIGLGRTVRATYAEAVLSLELRQARERILFRSILEGGNVLWGGLLSARQLESAGQGVGYEAVGIRTDNRAAVSRASQRNVTLPSAAVMADYDTSKLDARSLLFVTLTGEKNNVVRRERVVVPAFGAVLGTDASRIFQDGTP